MKKILLLISGFLILAVGISLVLMNWESIIILFKAIIGGLLAIAGLAVMSIARD